MIPSLLGEPAAWGAAVWQLVALWLVGALCGWLIPRPSKTQGSSSASAVWQAAVSSSLAWRRATIAWHGFVIAREVWYHWTCPGTFRRLFSACCGWLAGRGWDFDFPMEANQGTARHGTPCSASAQAASTQDDTWYITAQDLEFFQQHAEPEPGQCKPAPGCSAWELMMDREIPGMVKYTAWRRTLANGKSEYRSVTISPDATAQEFMDMYFDDDNRPNWDTMIIANEALEHGSFAQRQQVVRWVRRFPFSFISDREYVIAKRMFARGDSLYGITKSVEHPRAPAGEGGVVRVDVFYSMWQSTTVECPWGSGRPACKTILLHHEQMKVPENLARFAVKHGMWGFVRKLSTETPKFVEQRRTRCGPYEVDAAAYGAGFAPNPPSALGGGGGGAAVGAAAGQFAAAARGPGMRRVNTAASTLSSVTGGSSEEQYNMGNGLLHRSSTGGLLLGHGTPRRSGSKLRGLAAFALASGLAMLVKRSGSSDRLPSSSGGSPVAARRARSTANVRRMRRARTEVRLADVEDSEATLRGLGGGRSGVRGGALGAKRAASSQLPSDLPSF